MPLGESDWELLARQVEGLSEDETHWLPVLANASALLFETLPDCNWVGFYLTPALIGTASGKDGLLLGPFQGRVACTHIPLGRGVCGTAVKEARTVRVEDVHAFPGHIACDSASRSEIVVPLFVDGRVVGVLDIDSPLRARFTTADEGGLNSIARVLEGALAECLRAH